jgi:CheY-like chemotaxis protein
MPAVIDRYVDRDLSQAHALVIDSNAASRTLLVSQLRDYGVGRVAQCARVQDARAKLENATYDFVLCEHYFSETNYSGQTLLDDLRRAQLLPFSTVFFMVTGEASYASVAEAAESALDGYLLKPFTPVSLFARLDSARTRKVHLGPIFQAIETNDFDTATALCKERFEKRQPFWLYAARIGAELLLRLHRQPEAKALFEAVIETRALPWAKLGIARVQLETGQPSKAINTLEALIGSDPNFGDAYDVMGQAQVETGSFAAALETYRMASSLTPDSVTRQQKFGMMAYYMGEKEAANRALSRACILGFESKMFDYQSLVLLAFSCLAAGDRKGLDRCVTDFGRVQQIESNRASVRVARLGAVVSLISIIARRQFAEAVQATRRLAADIEQPNFDFEAACNLAGVLSVLAATSVQLDEAEGWVRTLGRRYCNTRGLSEMLANACNTHEPYAALVRQCLNEINQMAEHAVSLTLAGDPAGAVKTLLTEAGNTLNIKLVDMAQQVLTRNRSKLTHAEVVSGQIAELRERCGGAAARPGHSADAARHAGGVALRTGGGQLAPPKAVLPEPDVTPDTAQPADLLRLRPETKPL